MNAPPARLEAIASGAISALEARKVLAAVSGDIDSLAARKLYIVLRSWVWKALDAKRRDPELREWHDLVKRAQSRVKAHERAAWQIQVLADLVYESVAVSGRRSVEDLLKLRHTREIIIALRDAPDGFLSKQALLDKLGLKQANLSRVMDNLIAGGLVERQQSGREAHYRLSREGLARSAEFPLPAVPDSVAKPGVATPAKEIAVAALSVDLATVLDIMQPTLDQHTKRFRDIAGVKTLEVVKSDDWEFGKFSRFSPVPSEVRGSSWTKKLDQGVSSAAEPRWTAEAAHG